MDRNNDSLVEDELPGSSSVSESPGEQENLGNNYLNNANDKQNVMELQKSIQSILVVMNQTFTTYRSLRNDFTFELGKLRKLNKKKRIVHKSLARIHAIRALCEIDLARSIKELKHQRVLVAQWKSYHITKSNGLENMPAEISTILGKYKNLIRFRKLRVTNLKKQLKKMNRQIFRILQFLKKSDQKARKLEENLKILSRRLY